MQKNGNELQGIGGNEAMTALYGKPSTATDRAFEPMPDNYLDDLRSIILSLEHRPDLLSLERFFVAINLQSRSMRPARTIEEAEPAINEGFKHGLQFDKQGAIWNIIDIGSGELIHAPDVFGETINY